jgi:hypothetical protein
MEYNQKVLERVDEHMKGAYDNYTLEYAANIQITNIEHFILDVDAQVCENIAYGTIKLSHCDKNVLSKEYQFYRILENNKLKTYILVDGSWYVKETDETNVAIDVKKVIEKWSKYDENYPEYRASLMKIEIGDVAYKANTEKIKISECGCLHRINTYVQSVERFFSTSNMKYDDEKLIQYIKNKAMRISTECTFISFGDSSIDLPKDIISGAIPTNDWCLLWNEFMPHINNTSEH